VQLTKLLEQRTHTLDQLSLMNELLERDSPSRSAMEEVLRAYVPGEDEVGEALASRLKAELSWLRAPG